jgi:glycosyltransferase involved in cell wall biosynthesis
MKKILLVTQYFYPENFKSNDIAFELVKRGFEVDALVGIPNYPEGKYYRGYHIFSNRKETINGVRIIRVFQFPRGKNRITLSLNYLSYVVCASIRALFLSFGKRYDVVFVHQTSPVTQGIPAIVIKKIQNIPLFLWVLDLWPDAMISGGNVRNSYLLDKVNEVVKYMYGTADKILISSKGMVQHISEKGNFAHKIVYFPNWSDDIKFMPDNHPFPDLPEGFRIMLAGNLGKSQNLDVIMDAVQILRDISELKWIFVGGGSKLGWLSEFVEKKRLSDKVYLPGRFPAEAMPGLFKHADALLLSLRNGFPHLSMIVPARLQTYLAAGKPVLAMINGDAARLIEEAHCGYAVSAGDSAGLAELIRNKVLTDKTGFAKLGTNGREYFERYFSKDICIDNLCRMLNEYELNCKIP